MTRTRPASPFVVLALCLSTVLVTACDGGAQPKSDQPGPPADGATADTLPDELLLESAPEGAVAVATAKRSAQPGEMITVRGRVGGRKDPVLAGRASFLLADPDQIAACDSRDDDECPTPWDFCCEPKEKITANTITVQVADDKGRALKLDLGALTGIEPGSFVVVRGKVGPRPDPNALVISADAIYVE